MALVDAVVAEAPVALVAQVAPPVTLVRPGQAAGAKVTALEPLDGVVGRQRPPTVGAAGRDLGR